MPVQATPTPKLEELLSRYDDHVLEAVHSSLQKSNMTTQERRIDGHPDIQAILDEAHMLQAQAQREGELHVVERHRSGPQIFFAQGEKICFWEAGKIKVLSYDSGGRSFDLFSIVRDNNGSSILNIRERINDNLWRHVMFNVDRGNSSGLPPSNHHGQLHDIITDASGMIMYLTDMGPARNTISGPVTNLKLGQLRVLTDAEGNMPRMTMDQRNSIYYFIHRGQFIGSLAAKHITKKNGVGTPYGKVKNILNSGQMGQPVDLEFDQRNQLLLIQDAKARTIFAHNPNKNLERPSFRNMNDYLELPPQSLQSGKNLSLCCWIHQMDDRDERWWDGPAAKSMLQLRVTKKHEAEFWFYEDGILKHIKEKVTISKGWNHIALVKEGPAFRFFVNGELAFTNPAPTEIDTYLRNPELFFKFSVPGYIVAELNLWNKARSMQEIRDTMRTWITGHPEGLSAYWKLEKRSHLVSVMKAGKLSKAPTIAFDYSGNNFHATKFVGRWKKQSSSPLSPMIPLYRFEVLRNGISIDSNTGQVYWIDLRPDGEYYIMQGSVFGHTPANPIAPVQSNGSVLVISAENNPYEKLILAHARRREAIREAMQNTSHAHEEGHSEIMDAHDSIEAAHITTSTNLEFLESNKGTKSEVQQHWMRVLDDMHTREKNAERAAANRRLNALEQARAIVAQAHAQASQIKREASEKILNQRREISDT